MYCVVTKWAWSSTIIHVVSGHHGHGPFCQPQCHCSIQLLSTNQGLDFSFRAAAQRSTDNSACFTKEWSVFFMKLGVNVALSVLILLARGSTHEDSRRRRRRLMFFTVYAQEVTCHVVHFANLCKSANASSNPCQPSLKGFVRSTPAAVAHVCTAA